MITSLVFLISAPFSGSIYKWIDPAKSNPLMAVFGIILLLLSVWINFSQAIHLKQLRTKGASNGKVVAGMLIFLSLFQYFMIIYSFPKYADVSDKMAQAIFTVIFILILLLAGIELYLFFSDRKHFPFFIKKAESSRNAYLLLVAFTTWFVWDVQMIQGPQQYRSKSDTVIVYILAYTLTVVVFKRYIKIENIKL